MQDDACKSMKTNHVSAQAREEIESTVELLAHAKRPRQLSGPSVSYKESHGLGTTLSGNTQKTKELVTEKNTKYTRNNKVYAQAIQEIQGKPRFFDRSLKPG